MASLSEEYKKLREVGADFVTHAEWGARYDYSNERTVVEPATQVFVHITITEPNNYRSHAAHVRAIEAIGISRFPSTGISYNRVILFGVSKPYIGQKMSRRGAHTVNNYGTSTCQRWGSQCPGQGGSVRTPGGSTNLNYSARAYAYGANTHHSVTDSVLDTFARSIAADIKAGFVRRDAKIHGHRCVSSKSCPGDRMWERMHDLERRVEHYLSTPEDDMPLSDADLDKIDALIETRLTQRRGVYGFGSTVPTSVASNGAKYAWGAYLRANAALKLVRAQQPLLEAAAQGDALSAEDVATVAAACAAAVPEGLAEDIVDELHERTAPDTD